MQVELSTQIHEHHRNGNGNVNVGLKTDSRLQSLSLESVKTSLQRSTWTSVCVWLTFGSTLQVCPCFPFLGSVFGALLTPPNPIHSFLLIQVNKLSQESTQSIIYFSLFWSRERVVFQTAIICFMQTGKKKQKQVQETW